MPFDDVDDVGPIERPRPTLEGLRAEVVLGVIELELEDVIGPARERAGGFTDVVLCVVAHSHREQLQQLPAKVLVGVVFDVLPVVQIDEHRWIPEDPQQ